ncbi:hypothetical protein ACFQDG_05835 [Natronoarchaeum mannanilyticum]|uniref:Uncharacterized protein n=1 Tax=Natronoarchaeum mannanilyticum TaxID=926360 RepID=A0AAV3T9R2_9EURY
MAALLGLPAPLPRRRLIGLARRRSTGRRLLTAPRRLLALLGWLLALGWLPLFARLPSRRLLALLWWLLTLLLWLLALLWWLLSLLWHLLLCRSLLGLVLSGRLRPLLASCRLLLRRLPSPAAGLLAVLRRLLFPPSAAERLFPTRIALFSMRCRSSVRSLVVSVSWHDRCSRVSPERDALPVSRTRFHESA